MHFTSNLILLIQDELSSKLVSKTSLVFPLNNAWIVYFANIPHEKTNKRTICFTKKGNIPDREGWSSWLSLFIGLYYENIQSSCIWSISNWKVTKFITAQFSIHHCTFSIYHCTNWSSPIYSWASQIIHDKPNVACRLPLRCNKNSDRGTLDHWTAKLLDYHGFLGSKTNGMLASGIRHCQFHHQEH